MAADRPVWWAYLLWAGAGVLLSFGYAGMASIGIYLLALGLILIVAGVILPAARNSAAVAIIAGLGAAPLFIAWNNREGPGTVCRSGLGGTSCVELWNPWPFLTVGVALVAVGVGMAWWSRRPG